MSRAGGAFLDNGDIFPVLKFNTVEGGVIELPKDFGPGWSVLLFYRGHW